VHVALYLPQFLDDGLLTGVLTSRDDCLFVESDRGVTYGVAWPAGDTTWNPWSGTVRVRQLEASIGDRVTVGGGSEEVSPPEIGHFPFAVPPRSDCLGDELLFAHSIEKGSD
jgi:hypothetical protein